MNLFKLVGRNLQRNPARSILTALTIALATFIFLVLASVPASMDKIVRDASATLRLIVLNRSLPLYGLPARYCNDIREMPGCAACVAITGWPATYRDASAQILAVAEGLEIADVFPDYDLGGEASRALQRERRGAFAGRILMARNGWRPGQQVTLRGVDRDHLALDFVILGEMPAKRYPNMFAFRRDYLEEARRAIGHPNPDLALNLVVRVNSPAQVDSLIKEIDRYFRNSDYETRTLTESDALAGGLSSVGDIRAIVLSLCAIVILTFFLIAANSTAMMVRERMNEVAVMRALGFSRSTISLMLFGECGAIGLAGGVIGGTTALYIFGAGLSLRVTGDIGALWVTPSGAIAAIIIAVAISLISGLGPIWSAIRTPPAEAIGKVV
ncbi:MAG: ABC transporter permease [Candidatus Binatus sp.]|uniref:ABC transporter permease n=1 Tax=Candidatus Binatus sp. TaxID=2811406 RepID=UPI00271ECDFD|nr:ABC transporter permease [Candidatus Binatus sp.]MDO8433591.1 ABC transporter permease [Candidatus Binatus sp.]